MSTLFERVREAVASRYEVEVLGDDALRFEEEEVATVCIVLGARPVLVCYTVWPEFVVESHQVAALAPVLLEVNAELFGSTIELDTGAYGLSARTSVACGRLDAVSDEVFTGVVLDAVDESRATLAAYVPTLASALGLAPVD